MITLYNNSKVIFMSEIKEGDRFPYAGWNTIGNLVNVLAHRFEEQNVRNPRRTIAAIQKLREKGFLTPEECGDTGHGLNAHWIVEKAITMDLRTRVRNQEVQVHEVLKELKVA